MMYGREAKLPIDFAVPSGPKTSKPNSTTDFARQLQQLQQVKQEVEEIATKNLAKAQEQQKRNFDKSGVAPAMKVGQTVLLKNSRKLTCKGGKLQKSWSKPHVIAEVLPKGRYVIDRLKKTYNRSCLKEYFDPQQCFQYGEESSIPIPGKATQPCAPISIPSKGTEQKIEDITNFKPAKRATRAASWNKKLMIHIIDHADLVGGRPTSDAIINAAQQLLKTVDPLIEGLQPTVLSQSLAFRPFDRASIISGNARHIQIHHTGGFHWVVTAKKSMSKPNEIELYDSLLSKPSIDLELQLGQIYGCLTSAVSGPPQFKSLVIAAQPVHQQGASLDCGVFAVAYATDLVFSIDPLSSRYDVATM